MALIRKRDRKGRTVSLGGVGKVLGPMFSLVSLPGLISGAEEWGAWLAWLPRGSGALVVFGLAIVLTVAANLDWILLRLGWTPVGSPPTAMNASGMDTDFVEFRDRASKLWEMLDVAYRTEGFMGHGGSRAAFTMTVTGASWPDDSDAPRSEVQNIYDSSLSDLARRVYSGVGARALSDTDYRACDSIRRHLSETVRDWSRRLDQEGFPDWVRGTVRPNHENTVKLLWYLEIANAEMAGMANANYDFLRAVRDAMTVPPPPH